MMGTKKQKSDNKGFTLAELLVVIAIIGILAGVSFVAVGRYLRNLQQLEMDNTAKEIFIAAQNHLSASFASGELQRAYENSGTDVEDDFGDDIGHRPGYVENEAVLSGDEEYRYFIFNGYSDTSGAKKSVLEKYMLPMFAIDTEIADDGNYIIAYEVKSASVLAVFYSGRAHTFFGSKKVHAFEDDEAKESGNTYLADAVADRNKRLHYRPDYKDEIIGCYTSTGKDVIPEKTFKPLTLSLDNGAKLTAAITNPNYEMNYDKQILTLVVEGVTSKNKQIIKLKAKGETSLSGKSTFETSYENTNGPARSAENRTYTAIKYDSDAATHEETITFTLDDITIENGHFYNNFPYLIPGEDVEIYVELSDTGSFASTIRSETETVNSLFENITTKSGKAELAEIGNIRHLENLDPEISNLSFIETRSDVSFNSALKTQAEIIDIKKAEQIKDISYSGNGSFIAELSGDTTQHISTYPVYKYSGTDSDRKEGYYAISNANLRSYDGHKHNIYNIYSKTGSGEHVGIFSKVLFTSPSDTFTVRNLTVREGRFYGTNDAGVIIGHSDYDVAIENCTATGYQTDVKSENANAGGLLGTCVGKLTVNNSVVSGWVLNIGAKVSGMASGGLVGKCSGNLALKYSDLEGSSVNITSTNGTAGGLIGDAAAVTLTSSFLKADSLEITGNANAGGLIGKISGACKLSGNCYLSKNRTEKPYYVTIKATGGNAGGVVGNSSTSTASLEITGFHIDGSEFSSFNIEGTDSAEGTAGGLVGKAEGSLTIDTAYVIGKVLKLKANTAGGIAGTTSGNLDIKKTYASAYVFGVDNAGGFIGSIEGGSGNKIETSYASGHTKNGIYSTGTEKTAVSDNYNVQSSGNAGGFIGYASVTVSISNSYTTCSAYSSSTTGYSGGFVGNSVNISVNNCYSAGLVGIAEGGKAGGFAGSGTVTGNETGKSYYLKGKDFNSGFGALGNGTALYVEASSSTAGEGIAASGTDLDAVPWDETLVTSNGKAIYPYKTIAELSGNSNDLSVHNGDWAIAAPNNISLRISNAEKLSAILVVPTVTLQGTGDHYASMVVQGMDSGKIAYMQLLLQTGDVSLVEKDYALQNIIAADGDTDGSDDIVFPSKLSKMVTSEAEAGNTLFHIYLDDVTKAGFNFAALFPGFYPGEDLRIAVTDGIKDWGDIIYAAETEETSEIDPKLKASGITNSLFADGSGNADYSKASYYSDIKADTEIIAPEGNHSNYREIAFILNFRHLQNLDKYVSGVRNEYKRVKLRRNLYWKASNASGNNTIPTGYTAFTDVIHNLNGTTLMNIYPYDATDEYTGVIAKDDSFCGIINKNILEFDGGSHSINNLLINNQNDGAAGTDTKLNSDAGLFRFIGNDSREISIHDLTMIEPVIITEKGSAGGLIGNIQNGDASTTGTLKLNYVYVYGKDSLVRTTSDEDGNNGPNAGGLIGTATFGGYTIENCGASAYVYASTSRCAGGFIGDFKPRALTRVTNCFVGGHVKDVANGYDYVGNEAVTGDGVTIDNPGGFNVNGNVASGGFIGFLGTNMPQTTTFTKCFTTASVHSTRGVSGYSVDKDKGATGGFAGRIQYKYQNYVNCYVAGKIFAGSSLVGGFIGHQNKYSDLSESERPNYTENYVLAGLDFNDNETSTLPLVGYGTSSLGHSVTGIYFAEHDDEALVNTYYAEVDTVTFNRESEHYPYKDSAGNTYPTGTEHTVFYGDWVEPDNRSPVKILNGNRLIARINLRSDTCTTENINERDYFVTYIRLKGLFSGAEAVFRAYYVNGEAHLDQVNPSGDNFNNPSYSNHNDSKIVVNYSGGIPQYIDFCIDNVSDYSNNYRSTMPSSNGHAPKPGEDFTIYVSSTLTEVQSYFAPSATANSLFQKIEEIKDSTGTGTGKYIAYIANSRHLMNINSSVSSIDTGGIKVTKAVQTDNIYWIDDGTYAAGVNYKAATPPYETELNGKGILFDYQTYGTNSGEMMSLASANLELYEGNGKTIYNAVMGRNADNAYIGLFSRNLCTLTIQNLVLVSPRINNTTNFTSTGILVGLAEHDLTVKNLSMLGDIQVTKGGTSGVITGSANNNLTIDNVNINGTVTVYALDNDGAIAGGLVGETKGVTSVNAVNMGSTITVKGAQIAGGLVGKAGNSITITHTAATGTVNVTASVYSGGAIGTVTGGTADLNDVGIVTANGIISNTNNNAWYGGVGGFIGELTDTVMNIRNCYASAYVDGYGNGVGGFIGNLGITTELRYCKGTIQNCYASGHTSGGVFVASDVSAVAGHYNVIGRNSVAVGGFIGNAQGDATNKVYLKKCFSTNSLYSVTFGTNFFAGGFAGVLGDNVDVENCYTISYLVYNDANVGSFAGNFGGSVAVRDSYCCINFWPLLGEQQMTAVAKNYSAIDVSHMAVNNDLSPILETYTETEDNRCTAVHNDQTVGLPSKYPYKNWTDKTGSLAPGVDSEIKFYGDWV